MEKIIVNELTKVFGDRPQVALSMMSQGIDKQAIFAQTGQTIGVNRASFTVNEGEIFVVMGLSGSGKSTLVRLLNRLIEPSAGSIHVNGRDIRSLSGQALRQLRRREMAMVFQSFALMPHLTALENAAMGLAFAGLGASERQARALTALDQVGLADWAQAYPDELSGGMKQRVGLARALANDPEILLMDEAFSALDPLIRGEMQEELLRLQAQHQRTIVFISHDIDEAIRIGDRIALMEGGQIIQIGTPDELIRRPANDYVRTFFRGVNVSTVLTAGDIARKQQVTVIDRSGTGVVSALQRLKEHERDFGYVVDPKQVFHGIVSTDTLTPLRNRTDAKLAEAFLPDIRPLKTTQLLNDILGDVAAAPCGLPVVDDQGRYRGVITKSRLLETLDRGTDR